MMFNSQQKKNSNIRTEMQYEDLFNLIPSKINLFATGEVLMNFAQFTKKETNVNQFIHLCAY